MTMIKAIRTHFQTAAKNTRLIEREKLILDPTKILPEVVLDAIVQLPTRLHVQMAKKAGLAHRHAAYMVSRREYSLYTASFEKASEDHRKAVLDAFQKASPGGFVMVITPDGKAPDSSIGHLFNPEKLADMFKASMIRQLSNVDLICRPVGEWLNDFEFALRDPGLSWNNKVSSYLGQGEMVLDFWRKLNSLPDWSAYATKANVPPGPGKNDPRFKKPVKKEQREAGGIWQPAPGLV